MDERTELSLGRPSVRPESRLFAVGTDNPDIEHHFLMLLNSEVIQNKSQDPIISALRLNDVRKSFCTLVVCHCKTNFTLCSMCATPIGLVRNTSCAQSVETYPSSKLEKKMSLSNSKVIPRPTALDFFEIYSYSDTDVPFRYNSDLS